jgi:hypothetical protein
MRNQEQEDRLQYLASVHAYRAARIAAAVGEHSPCGPMGTAERLARESLADFESRYLDELRAVHAV